MGEKRPEKETILKASVEKALCYFDIFSYPLLAEEVWAFCLDVPSTPAEIEAALQSLVLEGIVASHTVPGPQGTERKTYYSIEDSVYRLDEATFEQLSHPPPSSSLPHRVLKRQEYNQRADNLLPLAYQMGRFIGAFPFVRGVFISGSLSKHAMKPDSDIDFFIVTKPERLWIARTLLACFKKIFLFNSHKYFCINYFVDTDHLEIEDKNLFTAVETVTLIPVYGKEWYHDFCHQNGWAWRLFPNMASRPTEKTPPHQRSIGKKILEYTLSGAWATQLDRFLMRVTVRFWRRKFRDYDPDLFEQAFRSAPHLSKHHPQYFQKQVLDALSNAAQKEN